MRRGHLETMRTTMTMTIQRTKNRKKKGHGSYPFGDVPSHCLRPRSWYWAQCFIAAASSWCHLASVGTKTTKAEAIGCRPQGRGGCAALVVEWVLALPLPVFLILVAKGNKDGEDTKGGGEPGKEDMDNFGATASQTKTTLTRNPGGPAVVEAAVRCSPGPAAVSESCTAMTCMGCLCVLRAEKYSRGGGQVPPRF